MSNVEPVHAQRPLKRFRIHRPELLPCSEADASLFAREQMKTTIHKLSKNCRGKVDIKSRRFTEVSCVCARGGLYLRSKTLVMRDFEKREDE